MTAKDDNMQSGTSGAPPAVRGAPALDTLMDVTLPVTIEFGRTSMTVEEVLELRPGSVVQLDRLVGEPIDIFVSDRKLASGEVVVVGEHFGVRVTKIIAEDEIEADS